METYFQVLKQIQIASKPEQPGLSSSTRLEVVYLELSPSGIEFVDCAYIIFVIT